MKKFFLFFIILLTTSIYAFATDTLVFSEEKAIHNYVVNVKLKDSNNVVYGICTGTGPIRFGASRELGLSDDFTELMAGHVMVVPEAFSLSEEGHVISDKLYSLDLLSDLYVDDEDNGTNGDKSGTAIYYKDQTVWCIDTSTRGQEYHGSWHNPYGNFTPVNAWYTSYNPANYAVYSRTQFIDSESCDVKFGFKDNDGNIIYVAGKLKVTGQCAADDCHYLTVDSAGNLSTMNEYKFETQSVFERVEDEAPVNYSTKLIKILDKNGNVVTTGTNLITTYGNGKNGFVYTPGYVYYVKVGNVAVNTLDSYTIVYDATVDKVQNVKIYNQSPIATKLINGKLIFRIGPSVHDWHYSATENSIIAKCSHKYCQHGLDPLNLSFDVPVWETVKAIFDPENPTNKELTWSSADSSTATAYANGNIVGVKKGTTTVTAHSTDGSKKKATLDVTVIEPYTSDDIFKAGTKVSIGFESGDDIDVVDFLCDGSSYACTQVLEKDKREKYYTDYTVEYSPSCSAEMRTVAGGKEFCFSMGSAYLEVSSADDTYTTALIGQHQGISKMLFFSLNGYDILGKLTQAPN